MMGSSSKYEAKSHQETSFQFLLLNGVTKVLVQVQISKAVRAEDRPQQNWKNDYWPGSLLKGSQGTSSPACLIHRARRLSIFSLPASLPPPLPQRILLEAVSKARLNAFGSHSHIYLAPGRYTATAQATLPNPQDRATPHLLWHPQWHESTFSNLGPSVGTVPALARA